MDFRYTVAICHLNMVETVEESVLSIYENTTDEFEILIVDDGSTDGSLAVLEDLSDEYDRVRLVHGSNETIAQARNSSIEHSKADIVLHQLDADDRYAAGIVDLAKVFDSLDEAVDDDVYLRGQNIHIARRDLLQRIPYNDVGYGEDLDLWRRMDAADDVEMVWLRHAEINEEIGYSRNLLEYAKVRYSTAKVNLQTGITATSYARWMLHELTPGGWQMRPWYGALFHIAITPIAYAHSLSDGHVGDDLPDAYTDFCWYMNHILESTVTVNQLIGRHNLPIDEESFSDAGVEMFYGDDVSTPEETAP